MHDTGKNKGCLLKFYEIGGNYLTAQGKIPMMCYIRVFQRNVSVPEREVFPEWRIV